MPTQPLNFFPAGTDQFLQTKAQADQRWFLQDGFFVSKLGPMQVPRKTVLLSLTNDAPSNPVYKNPNDTSDPTIPENLPYVAPETGANPSILYNGFLDLVNEETIFGITLRNLNPATESYIVLNIFIEKESPSKNFDIILEGTYTGSVPGVHNPLSLDFLRVNVAQETNYNCYALVMPVYVDYLWNVHVYIASGLSGAAIKVVQLQSWKDLGSFPQAGLSYTPYPVAIKELDNNRLLGIYSNNSNYLWFTTTNKNVSVNGNYWYLPQPVNSFVAFAIPNTFFYVADGAIVSHSMYGLTHTTCSAFTSLDSKIWFSWWDNKVFFTCSNLVYYVKVKQSGIDWVFDGVPVLLLQDATIPHIEGVNVFSAPATLIGYNMAAESVFTSGLNNPLSARLSTTISGGSGRQSAYDATLDHIIFWDNSTPFYTDSIGSAPVACPPGIYLDKPVEYVQHPNQMVCGLTMKDKNSNQFVGIGFRDCVNGWNLTAVYPFPSGLGNSLVRLSPRFLYSKATQKFFVWAMNYSSLNYSASNLLSLI